LPSGELQVSTPPHTPTFFIERFLEQQKDWIQQHQQHVLARPHFYDANQVTIFGKEYAIIIRSSDSTPSQVETTTSEVIVHLLKTGKILTPKEKAAKIKKLIEAFLKQTATHYIVRRTQQLGAQMHTQYFGLTLREQKSRWGSCSSKGNLNFNWRLVHFPTEIIDYVIVHELAHRTHMNHSASFWNLVGIYDPDCPKHKGWLKRFGGAD